GVPPVAAPGAAQDNQKQHNRGDVRRHRRHGNFHAALDTFLSACTSEIDFDHWSNPLKAKPMATASAGPRDVTLNAFTFGPIEMLLNGSRTSVGHAKLSWILFARPVIWEVPPLIRIRVIVSSG